MKIYELKLTASSPTPQTLNVPSDSTVGFSINLITKDDEEIRNLKVFTKSGEEVVSEGFLDNFNSINYYRYNSLAEGNSETYTVKYDLIKASKTYKFETTINFNATVSGFSYKTSATNTPSIDPEALSTITEKLNAINNKIDENRLVINDTLIAVNECNSKLDQNYIPKSEVDKQINKVNDQLAAL